MKPKNTSDLSMFLRAMKIAEKKSDCHHVASWNDENKSVSCQKCGLTVFFHDVPTDLKTPDQNPKDPMGWVSRDSD